MQKYKFGRLTCFKSQGDIEAATLIKFSALLRGMEFGFNWSSKVTACSYSIEIQYDKKALLTRLKEFKEKKLI